MSASDQKIAGLLQLMKACGEYLAVVEDGHLEPRTFNEPIIDASVAKIRAALTQVDES